MCKTRTSENFGRKREKKKTHIDSECERARNRANKQPNRTGRPYANGEEGNVKITVARSA